MLRALSFAALLLAGCQAPQAEQDPPLQPQLRDADGRCFGSDTAPARFETITSQVLLSPERRNSAGEIIAPARYQTRTEQRIAQERHEITFETPCPDAFTPEFIASVQRALSARGYYQGPIDGALSAETGRAIRAFQRRFGPDSGILSLIAAQRLGLVALSAEQLGAASRP